MAKAKMTVPKDFQIGDIVLVESNGRDFRKSPRWKNGWVDSMDEYVGKCWEVKVANDERGLGVFLKPIGEDGASFGFPEKSLRLIKRGKNTYFRLGDKVLVVRKSEEIIRWNGDGLMDGAVGKVYEIDTLFGQSDSYQPAVHLKTETGRWFFGSDCVELYTGQTPDEQPKPQPQPQPNPIFTITEPLQSWERF